jgi:four helix bundle protein
MQSWGFGEVAVSAMASSGEHRQILSFRDLDAWQSAMSLAVAVYAVVKRLPADERFELSAQIRRAAVSVPSNIAEGYGHRDSPKTYAKHVRVALGSLAELETDAELIVRLRLLPPENLEELNPQLTRTGQLLYGLLRALRRATDRSKRRT